MLLEHIKRYDKERMIKLVSVDNLRSRNIKLDSKIHSVPALMLMPSKEVLFGKTVFDHLLLPPRGVLCSGQSTRNDKNAKKENALDAPDSSINKPTLQTGDNDEPSAFSLNTGTILSDNFSNIDDSVDTIIDKNYKWDTITGENIVTFQASITDIDMKPQNSQNLLEKQTSQMQQPNILNNKEEKKDKLPSIEELMKQRDQEIMFK
jgi:hypothetical protein